MTPEACRWLLTDEATPILDELADQQVTPAVVTALRKRVAGSSEKASAALELAELRRRAKAKFRYAERMFFTRKSYEQATDEWIARYKAARFEGSESVVDACCGIGGDLLGLAGVAEQAWGIDADPEVARFASRNAQVYGVKPSVESFELTAEAFAPCDAWHTDPDRRPAGRRTTQPDQHNPSLETLKRWRKKVPSAAIKFAPAARLPDDWSNEVELEWVSRGGECRQLVAWCGPLARHSGRCVATQVDQSGGATSLFGEPGLPVPATSKLRRWLHEPDPAVLAADLVGTLTERHGLEAISPPLPYLTSDSAIDDRLISSFEVVESMPLDRKRLSAWLSERGIGRLEIKCRGVDLVPERLRSELKPRGDDASTLLAFPSMTGGIQVVIARRPD